MNYRPKVWYKCPKCGDLKESDLAEELCHHAHEETYYVMHRSQVYVSERYDDVDTA